MRLSGSTLDVGRGTVADATVLIDSASGGDPTLVFDTGATNRSAIIRFKDQGTVSGFINYHHQYDRMDFGSGSSTGIGMSLTSGGNLLIGKTALEYENTAGHIFRNDGLQVSIRDSGNVADFNRLSSDGEILRLSKDGATVGSIGTAGNQSYIHGAGTDTGLYWGSNNVYPYRSTGLNDATIDLGQTTHRFKDLYLSHCAKVPKIGATGRWLIF